mgnify:FL=1
MHKKKIENIFKLSAKERFSYFVRKLTDLEEVCGLSEGTEWALLWDNYNNKLFPVWPEKDFAEICANGPWNSYIPKLIKLEDFISKLSIKLDSEEINYAVFLTTENKGIIISPKELCEVLEMEIEQEEYD